MNYIENIYNLLDQELQMQDTFYKELLETYGLLVLTVGENCTQKHIHDAWSVWQNKIQPNHHSLIPFEDLAEDVKEIDEPYRQAVVKVAKLIN